MAILGGAKVSDKIPVIQNLMKKVNVLIIGGGMAYTFLKAQGQEIGKSLVENDKLDLAKELLQEAKSRGLKFLLPVDHVVADKVDASAKAQQIGVGQPIPADLMALDIGPKSVELFTGRNLHCENHHLERPDGRVRGAAIRQGHVQGCACSGRQWRRDFDRRRR